MRQLNVYVDTKYLDNENKINYKYKKIFTTDITNKPYFNHILTKDKWWVATKGNFEEITNPQEIRKIMSRAKVFSSGSGSKYWIKGDMLYRYSDHWGDEIATCSWRLNNKEIWGNGKNYYMGKINLRKLEPQDTFFDRIFVKDLTKIAKVIK